MIAGPVANKAYNWRWYSYIILYWYICLEKLSVWATTSSWCSSKGPPFNQFLLGANQRRVMTLWLSKWFSNHQYPWIHGNFRLNHLRISYLQKHHCVQGTWGSVHSTKMDLLRSPQCITSSPWPTLDNQQWSSKKSKHDYSWNMLKHVCQHLCQHLC